LVIGIFFDQSEGFDMCKVLEEKHETSCPTSTGLNALETIKLKRRISAKDKIVILADDTSLTYL
jgi:cysteine synthase